VEPVNAHALFQACSHIQTQALAKCAADGTAHGVGLPPGDSDHLSHGRTWVGFQQCDQLGLFGLRGL
jgi:hypothetical protein